jgi:hypothetical protein
VGFTLSRSGLESLYIPGTARAGEAPVRNGDTGGLVRFPARGGATEVSPCEANERLAHSLAQPDAGNRLSRVRSVAEAQTIMSIAGHVSPKMLATYSHIRMDAKRKALDALSGRASGGSYGTNDGTNPQSAEIPDSQVIDKIGGREGARTPDLLVANPSTRTHDKPVRPQVI